MSIPSQRQSLTPEPVAYPFPALAAHAAGSPMGGDRETVMACLLAARLALGMTAERAVDREQRAARASGARVWLAAHALPARIRAALERLYDATALDAAAPVARGLRSVMEMAGARLNVASREELARLAARLDVAAAPVAGGERGASSSK